MAKKRTDAAPEAIQIVAPAFDKLTRLLRELVKTLEPPLPGRLTARTIDDDEQALIERRLDRSVLTIFCGHGESGHLALGHNRKIDAEQVNDSWLLFCYCCFAGPKFSTNAKYAVGYSGNLPFAVDETGQSLASTFGTPIQIAAEPEFGPGTYERLRSWYREEIEELDSDLEPSEYSLLLSLLLKDHLDQLCSGGK